MFVSDEDGTRYSCSTSDFNIYFNNNHPYYYILCKNDI